MPLVDLKLESEKGYPDIYSIKVNGIEISDHISELNLNLKAGGIPVLTIKANVEPISLSSRAICSIPEPYKAFYDPYEAFYEKCRSEFLSHERDAPNQGV